mmetsp:Transcript_71289/g.218432  ORF Transcript_71289/g.218432 Transcript_71289/m.218432 type:complete len:217 (-) Transcript_71289:304-954(-)
MGIDRPNVNRAGTTPQAAPISPPETRPVAPPPVPSATAPPTAEAAVTCARGSVTASFTPSENSETFVLPNSNDSITCAWAEHARDRAADTVVLIIFLCRIFSSAETSLAASAVHATCSMPRTRSSKFSAVPILRSSDMETLCVTDMAPGSPVGVMEVLEGRRGIAFNSGTIRMVSVAAALDLPLETLLSFALFTDRPRRIRRSVQGSNWDKGCWNT